MLTLLPDSQKYDELYQLPIELWLLIINNLDAQTLINFSLISKTGRMISLDIMLWCRFICNSTDRNKDKWYQITNERLINYNITFLNKDIKMIAKIWYYFNDCIHNHHIISYCDKCRYVELGVVMVIRKIAELLLIEESLLKHFLSSPIGFYKILVSLQ